MPPFDVLWTYPEDGDDDVPTNAQLWVLTSVWSSAATITLNGEPLTGEAQSFGSQVIDPGPLEADTDYELELVFNTLGVGAEQVVAIAFRTGTEAADAASAPEATGHMAAMGHFGSHTCADVVRAQDCFDTGQDTLLTVAMEDDDAIGWHIQLAGHGTRAVWPARCGDPGLYMGHQNLPRACFDVRKIAPGGLISEATQFCPPDDAMMSDAAVPEPSNDASVPGDRQDAGVVDPIDTDAGTSGGGGTRADNPPPQPSSGGTGGAGESGIGGSGGAAPSTKKDDGGCSATSQRGQNGSTALAWLLGVLAFAIGRRRRTR